ncbi:chemokine (C-C motif) ligand 34b, duplicate 4 [Trichomycterus rosablanca]|uniref:chemokine (C-C motif) ligand 34b, duplicate 4 n=1 Tax=Trichomycterus rosablanca TaxID=2290929 RepID=UPI002F351679
MLDKQLTLVVLLMLFGCITAAHANYRRPTKVGVLCCEAVSKAMIPHDIKLTGYKHQNDLSPCVEAIVFYSKDERFCSDPSARWIKRKQKGLREIKD